MASRPLHSTFFKFEKKNAELFSSVFSVNFDIWEFLDYRGLPDIEVTMIGKGFHPPGNAWDEQRPLIEVQDMCGHTYAPHHISTWVG